VRAPDAFAPDSNEATQKLEQQLLMVLLPGLLLLLLVFLLREQTATARARAARKRARSKRVAEKHTRDASLDPPLPQPSRLCQDAAYPRGNHPNASWSDHEQLSQQARGARSLQNLRTGHPKAATSTAINRRPLRVLIESLSGRSIPRLKPC